MISVLLIWVYTLVLIYLYGWGAARLVACLLRRDVGTQSPVPLLLAAGLCAVTTITGLLSLFIKIGLAANLLLLAGGILIVAGAGRSGGKLLVSPFRTHLKPLEGALIVLVFLTTLIFAIGSPANPDTGIYHAQAIRWIETYKAVPGLGNLHSRFAYNANWMVANALFSFTFLGLRSFHLTNSILFLIAMLSFLGGVRNLTGGDARPSDLVKTLLLPLAFLTVGSEVSSPGTDLPVALLTWIVLTGAMDLCEQKEGSDTAQTYLLFILSVFAVTIKLSGAPLLLVALYLWIRQLIQRRYRRAVILALTGMLILAPWLARNVIVSGYLVYPLPEVDLFLLDWKMPSEIVLEDRVTTAAWARPRLPGQSVEDVLNMPLRQWAPIWYSYLTPNRKAIISAAAIAPLIYALLRFIVRRRVGWITGTLQPYLWVYTVSYIGLLYWFLTAPAFRFGYGFINITLAFALLPLLWLIWRLPGFNSTLISTGVILFLMAYQGMVLVQTSDWETLSENILLPADYKALPTHRCELRNLTVWCADEWDECWYEPFPCIPRPDPSVGLRGSTLEEGFNYQGSHP